MKLILLLSLILTAQASWAKGRTATKAEVRMLCQGVETMLEEEAADAAVDLEKCYKKKMKVTYDLEGTNIIGKVPLNTPNYSREQTCSGVVRGDVVKLVQCK